MAEEPVMPNWFRGRLGTASRVFFIDTVGEVV
jgi:hypothetical protein